MPKPLIFVTLGLALVLFFSRVTNLNSGIILTEPDEWYYFTAATSLNESTIPNVKGRALLEHSPLFEYLAHTIDFFVTENTYPKTYISTRLVSVLASFLLAFSLFVYLKRKVNTTVAIYGLLFLTLMPISIFYSKVGLREALLILGLFWFYAALDYHVLSNPTFKKSLLSGLLLGLTIAVKTIAVIFLLVPVIKIALNLGEAVWQHRFKSNLIIKHITDFNLFLRPNLNLLLVIMVGVLTTIVGFLPGYFYSPTQLKDSLVRSTIRHTDGSLKTIIQNWQYYLEHLNLWLSWPIILLAIVGLLYILRYQLKAWRRLVIFVFLILVMLTVNEPRARYFVLLLPFITILAGLGLNLTQQVINKRFKNLPTIVLPTILAAVIFPYSQIAYEGTNHSVFEQAFNKLRNLYPTQERTIFSTFWPPIIQDTSGYPTARLTRYKDDVNRDHAEYPNFSPYFNDHPAHFLTRPDYQGKLIFLVVKPLDQADLQERLAAVEMIESNPPHLEIFSDNKPNFPETAKSSQLYLYVN